MHNFHLSKLPKHPAFIKRSSVFPLHRSPVTFLFAASALLALLLSGCQSPSGENRSAASGGSGLASPTTPRHADYPLTTRDQHGARPEAAAPVEKRPTRPAYRDAATREPEAPPRPSGLQAPSAPREATVDLGAEDADDNTPRDPREGPRVQVPSAPAPRELAAVGAGGGEEALTPPEPPAYPIPEVPANEKILYFVEYPLITAIKMPAHDLFTEVPLAFLRFRDAWQSVVAARYPSFDPAYYRDLGLPAAEGSGVTWLTIKRWEQLPSGFVECVVEGRFVFGGTEVAFPPATGYSTRPFSPELPPREQHRVYQEAVVAAAQQVVGYWAAHLDLFE